MHQETLSFTLHGDGSNALTARLRTSRIVLGLCRGTRGRYISRSFAADLASTVHLVGSLWVGELTVDAVTNFRSVHKFYEACFLNKNW
jgi:hypothetical protein